MSLTKVTNRVLADNSVGTAQLASAVQQLLVPVGAVMSFARNTAPAGWLICDGASLSRTVSNNAYQPLHTAIGYAFGGSGDNFNLPDLRGEFIRGWAGARGVDTGRVFGSNQADDFRSHRHGSYINQSSPSNGPMALGPAQNDNAARYAANQFTLFDGGTETRPRNVALLYCIKWN